MHDGSYLFSGAAKLDEARGLPDVAVGSPLNWNGALLVGAAVAAAAPNGKEGVWPKLNVDGLAPKTGGAAPEAGAARLEKAKPPVAPTDETGAEIGLLVGAVVFDVPPKLNGEEFDEPKVEKDEADVTGLSNVEPRPNEAVEPKADGTVEVLDEITEGANVFGGLLAPNANGVLLDVVVVVIPVDGKLKPDDDDDELPNKDAVGNGPVLAVVVEVDAVAAAAAAPSGKPLENENPLLVEGTGRVVLDTVEAAVVGLDEKPNKLGGAGDVVTAGRLLTTATAGAETTVPNENEGGLSEARVDTVDPAIAVVGFALNEPNVMAADTCAGDDDDEVVVVVGIDGDAEAPVVVVGVNEPKDGNVELGFVLAGKRLVFPVAAVEPNRLGADQPNGATTGVVDALVTAISFVVAGNETGVIEPNMAGVLPAPKGVLNGGGGREGILSLVVDGGNVTVGVIMLDPVAKLMVTGFGAVGSSGITSGNLLEVVADSDRFSVGTVGVA